MATVRYFIAQKVPQSYNTREYEYLCIREQDTPEVERTCFFWSKFHEKVTTAARYKVGVVGVVVCLNHTQSTST